jgi:hypothetical protein
MEKSNQSELQGLSLLIEEHKNMDILVTDQDLSSTGHSIFLTGDVVLNNDILLFKGLHRMEYFCFRIKIYNLVSLTKHSDYLVLNVSDLSKYYQDNVKKNKYFEKSDVGKDSLIDNSSNANSMRFSKKIGSSLSSCALLEQFKSGNQFELIGNFQIRIIKRNEVRDS